MGNLIAYEDDIAKADSWDDLKALAQPVCNIVQLYVNKITMHVNEKSNPPAMLGRMEQGKSGGQTVLHNFTISTEISQCELWTTL